MCLLSPTLDHLEEPLATSVHSSSRFLPLLFFFLHRKLPYIWAFRRQRNNAKKPYPRGRVELDSDKNQCMSTARPVVSGARTRPQGWEGRF